jgi:hypothetical protein
LENLWKDILSNFSRALHGVSKLNLVDLAGSERTKKTAVTGQQLKEATYINKSLTFLEQTVNALRHGLT